MSKSRGQHEPLVYLNGRFLPQSEAVLPLHDAGFVMGATVTDLCRTFRFRLFRRAEHLRRFRQSCAAASIPQPLTDEQLTAIAERLIAHNQTLVDAEADLALVVFATPGVVGYYLGEPGGPGDATLTLGMHTFPLPFSRYRRLFEEGAMLAIPGVRHVPTVSIDHYIKHRSRLHWWLADREVHARNPAASALLLDDHGHVTETAAANFLLVKDGVSLQVTRELCDRLGIGFKERPLTVADCFAADEALLTSTPYGLAPVRQIEHHAYPAPGPVALELMAAWDETVGLSIGRQILANP